MGNLLNRIEYNKRITENKKPKRKRPTKREIGKLKESIEKVPRTEPLPIVTREAPSNHIGRPKTAKQVVSIRLEQDILDHFRGTGDGWQGRINDALRAHIRKV